MSAKMNAILEDESKIAAQVIVVDVDDEFGIDLAMYQRTELERLVTSIQSLLQTGVDTDDLACAGDILYDENGKMVDIYEEPEAEIEQED